jgi:hypothetical protein
MQINTKYKNSPHRLEPFYNYFGSCFSLFLQTDLFVYGGFKKAALEDNNKVYAVMDHIIKNKRENVQGRYNKSKQNKKSNFFANMIFEPLRRANRTKIRTSEIIQNLDPGNKTFLLLKIYKALLLLQRE